tara:strand:- start:301 stop:444 length:144 start_codon:yes stop_codon:yes gene_type:complete
LLLAVAVVVQVVMLKEVVAVVLVDLELGQPQLEHIQYQRLSRLVPVE